MSTVSLKAEALLIFYKTQLSGFMQVLGPEDPRNGSAVSSLHVLKPATHPLCALISSFVEDKNIFHRPHLGTIQVEFTLCILPMRNPRLREVRQPALYHTAPGSGATLPGPCVAIRAGRAGPTAGCNTTWAAKNKKQASLWRDRSEVGGKGVPEKRSRKHSQKPHHHLHTRTTHTPAGSVTPGALPLPCISHVKGVKSKVVIVSWLVVTRFSKLRSFFPKTVLIKKVQVCCDSQKPEIMLSGGLAVKRVKENILKGDMFNWFIYAWRAFCPQEIELTSQVSLIVLVGSRAVPTSLVTGVQTRPQLGGHCQAHRPNRRLGAIPGLRAVITPCMK